MHDRSEVEAAFRHWWRTGGVEERWADWVELFTDDVVYMEHVYGTMRGRDAVREWILPLMAKHPHVHAVLEWYLIEGDRVVLRMQNRYYNPEPGGPPFDFPGLTVLEYAGDGRFRYEEDYWDVALSRAAYEGFTAARRVHGDAALVEDEARRRLRDPWA